MSANKKSQEAQDWGSRVRVLLLAPSLLLHIIGQPDERVHITSAGLPDDAEFVAAYYDEGHRVFRIHIRSASFDVVPAGTMVPELEVNFTAHYRGLEG